MSDANADGQRTGAPASAEGRGGTGRQAVAEGTVFERFRSMAGMRDKAVAIEDGGRRISYRDLCAASDRLRVSLSHLDAVQPGFIAILTSNRTTAVTCMLGVAGSGHAYVPIDVNDPDARIASLLNQIRPLAILADGEHVSRVRGLAPQNCQTIDPDDLPLTGDSRVRPDTLRATPDSLLYVSFTSGSTGVPKGVCQTHRNLIFHAGAYIDLLGISAADRLSWLFAHGASASNMDIYGSLFAGACLCAYDLRGGSFGGLAAWLGDNRVTLLHTVPTVIRELAGEVPKGQRLQHIRAVDLAGEMLFARDVVRLRERLPPGCRIYNRLAATECSFISSIDISGVAAVDGVLPVGKPPPGVEVRILHEDGREAAPGEQGLIAIDSPHVCTAYLGGTGPENRVTEVSGRPGWRRYRSADLGCIDDRGNLRMVGRNSSRIKLRGHAVDLDEVEAALLTCPGVSGAAVVPRVIDGGEAREIIACLTLRAGAGVDPLAIRRRLSEQLPAHMLPAGFAFLDDLPRTSTSKVDRNALQSMDLEKVRYRPGYIPPATDTERQVAEIYAGVLQIRPVGRLDDFFLLGGDSLSLNSLQVLALEVFGRQIPGLTEDATVKGVAARLRDHSPVDAGTAPILLPLQSGGHAPPLFMVHGRLGQAHVGPHFLEALGPERSIYALQAKGLDGREPPHESIEAMAAEYLAAVKRVHPAGPILLGGLCAGSYVTLEMARTLHESGEPALAVLLIDPPYLPRPGVPVTLDAFPSDAELLYRIRRRVSEGSATVDLRDRGAVEASVRVARGFETAFRTHRWKGPVADTPLMVIASTNRWRNPKGVRWMFGQQAEAFMLDGDHEGILAPDNFALSEHLRQCLARIEHLTTLRGQDGTASKVKAEAGGAPSGIAGGLQPPLDA